MELVDRVDIQNYAKRNTSPKMPIESKYVYAFLDSLLNSTSVQKVYTALSDEMQHGDSFVIYSSYSLNARNVNKEPYRSIIAYAMLKKDFRLFELISASMFTGSVVEYHGNDLYTEMSFTTDEFPTKSTDEGLFTDMTPGLIQIGFKNYYCEDPLDDGTGSEYQTIEELEKAVEDFDYIITLTKPARVEALLFYVPWCYLSGDESTILTCGIDREDKNFTCPFGDPTSMSILDNMSDSEIAASYTEVSMYDYVHMLSRPIETTRGMRIEPDAIYLDYEFRCQASSSSAEEDNKDIIWGTIKIISNVGNMTYAQKKVYQEGEEYYEKYEPIMLRINDNDPDGPCLALEIENGTPTIGAMFYTRTREDD